MKEKILNLIEEYERNVELFEQDRAEEKYLTVSNAYRTAKIGVYQSVVNDLMAILEGESE